VLIKQIICLLGMRHCSSAPCRWVSHTPPPHCRDPRAARLLFPPNNPFLLCQGGGIGWSGGQEPGSNPGTLSMNTRRVPLHLASAGGFRPAGDTPWCLAAGCDTEESWTPTRLSRLRKPTSLPVSQQSRSPIMTPSQPV